MKSFKQFIEARRNPEQNPKISAFAALKKYKDDPDVYISFTDIDKIGVNPKSQFNTPLGIYTYPLKEVWEKYIEDRGNMQRIPFAGDRPNIYVVKLIDKKHFLDDMYQYGSNMFDKDEAALKKIWMQEVPKLKDKYKIQMTYNYSEEYAKIINDIDYYHFLVFMGKLKDTQKKLQELENKKLEMEKSLNLETAWNEVVVNAVSTAKEKNPIMSFWNLTRKMADLLADTNKSISIITKWNWLLRQCGYSGFADKQGRGYIHPAEPVQAVFLSTTAFKVIEKIANKDYKDVLIIDGKRIEYTPSENLILSYNDLTSLKGCPSIIEKDFLCENNQLTTLEFGPNEVGGSFDVSANKLKTLEHMAQKIGGNIKVSYNKLENLKGCPKVINGDFHCKNNNLKTLEGGPIYVDGDYICADNELTNLKGSPRTVEGTFMCSHNQLTSLEGVPKEVDGNFYCHGNAVQFTEEDVRKVCNVKGKIYA